MRKKQIRKAILAVLNEADPYMLFEHTVLSGINLAIAPPVVLSDFETHLREMETRRLIIRQADSDGDNKIKITTEGKAALNE